MPGSKFDTRTKTRNANRKRHLDKSVEFLISSDSKLQMARSDTFHLHTLACLVLLGQSQQRAKDPTAACTHSEFETHLQILGSVSCQLQDLSGEVLCIYRTLRVNMQK